MKLLHRIAAIFLVAASALPIAAQAADEWARSRKLSIDTSATGANLDAPVNQLPLLLRLHTGNFAFSEAKPDGSDLRFFAADGKTPLKFHIERYDSTNELGVVWVQVPVLQPASKANSVVVRWGNPGAAAAGDSKGTYDASQIFVLNFSDQGGVMDATANANNARDSSAKPLAFGLAGGAAGFDGNASVVLPASASLKLAAADGLTFTAWVKATAPGKGSLFTLGAGTSALVVELADGGFAALRMGGKSVLAKSPLKAAEWQHLAVTYAGGKAQFFVNGVPAGEGDLVMPDASGDATIGSGFRGELDGVTLARGARSPAYLKALFASQSADTPMMSFVDEAEQDSGPSYMTILLSAVTIDGWIVIGILGLMAVVSFWVMLTKTIALSQAEKANALFLDVFKDNSQALLDPANKAVRELDGMKAIQASSIYKLYKVGLHEIAQRFEKQAKANLPHNLSGPALESIRASLDATILRGNQKFNQGMVALTISISGGPFLGLLGTVVGVMITFAAIAAAGDVNVNAIAPGIAAALVATVAGLAVAIPALFAYNWFAIKIKNISADTQVFADEFLTKSAELHAG